jgi:4-hydroxy-3-methylbut-2-enyl diphosphate reductase
MIVLLANPRGFCAGVDRAIEIVARALEVLGPPIYVRHEVVHNQYVVTDLGRRGAVFVDELDQVPDGATVIFSAHGVARAVRERASARGLKVLDATCPLVTKVHMEVMHHGRDGRECILIGHAGHPEVEGTLGQYSSGPRAGIYLVETAEDVGRLQVRNPNDIAFVTQTTLSVDDTKNIIDGLRRRFPSIRGPRKDDICYATQNRQDAVKELAQRCDVVLVVGSPNSSNSNRLREVAERLETPAYLVDSAADVGNGRRVGPGGVGAASRHAPQRMGRQRSEGARRPPGEHFVLIAQIAAAACMRQRRGGSFSWLRKPRGQIPK